MKKLQAIVKQLINNSRFARRAYKLLAHLLIKTKVMPIKIELKIQYIASQLLQKSDAKDLIIQFRKLRPQYALKIIASSGVERQALLAGLGYQYATHPAHKDLEKSPAEKVIFANALTSLSNSTQAFDARLANFFTALFYAHPHNLDEKSVFEILEKLPLEYYKPAFACMFNLMIPYRDLKESEKHVAFIIKALSWLINKVDSIAAEQKRAILEIFAATYSGSMPMSSPTNLKRLFQFERALLRRYLDLSLGNIPKFKTSVSKARKKIKIGLLRRNYQGEIAFATPLFKYLNPEIYDLHLITFDANGIEKFKASYPGITHHLLDKHDLGASINTVRQLELDLLFNTNTLSGDFLNPLAALLSYRVAPIQLLGFADITTSGIEEIDYFLMGNKSQPTQLMEELFETVCAIPGCGFFMPINPTPPSDLVSRRVAKRATLKLAEKDILFTTSAHLFKITPELLTCWVEIIRSVPSSCLLLMPFNAPFFKNCYERGFIKLVAEMCAQAGVSNDRIIVSCVKGSEAVMDNLIAGDIYLDSFFYAGAISSTEALVLGQPVVTLAASQYRGQLTSGLHRVLGLSEMITHSIPDYIKRAVRLATDADHYAATTEKIRVALAEADFFKSPKHAEEVNQAFQRLLKLNRAE